MSDLLAHGGSERVEIAGGGQRQECTMQDEMGAVERVFLKLPDPRLVALATNHVTIQGSAIDGAARISRMHIVGAYGVHLFFASDGG
ncbi:hypothetical protein N7468_006528 [Penicillium chermesinum]|uniref:Uncharacterized protein n=1 Tax=Penicillium chermesinum TaxID=63820 RepID=A0A9W9TJR7_9EURO|nr:uncharacterized protein N7468_006528 [Penicillium chermesinum]KAJ5225303.1 hypothetical protein N7468_006528 [Penicillium chermesinum]KAJ6140606.1 hypothetical protein N7470_010402 [Penicillium chermesinum]